jgi:hypothetical protein
VVRFHAAPSHHYRPVPHRHRGSVHPGCAVPQDKGPDATPTSSTKPSAPALGETISAIDHNCSMALHDTNNSYWFNSGSNGDPANERAAAKGTGADHFAGAGFSSIKAFARWNE